MLIYNIYFTFTLWTVFNLDQSFICKFLSFEKAVKGFFP